MTLGKPSRISGLSGSCDGLPTEASHCDRTEERALPMPPPRERRKDGSEWNSPPQAVEQVIEGRRDGGELGWRAVTGVRVVILN